MHSVPSAHVFVRNRSASSGWNYLHLINRENTWNIARVKQASKHIEAPTYLCSQKPPGHENFYFKRKRNIKQEKALNGIVWYRAPFLCTPRCNLPSRAEAAYGKTLEMKGRQLKHDLLWKQLNCGFTIFSHNECQLTWNQSRTRPSNLCETQIFRLWVDRWKIFTRLTHLLSFVSLFQIRFINTF